MDNFKLNDVQLSIIKNMVEKMTKINSDIEKTFYKNVIDPFSAIFDAHFGKIEFDDWVKNEKTRQIQKSIQNDIGAFHENILGSFVGWENLKTGSVIDLKNDDKKIIAEIKNKFNTTKGNHKNAIYDDLESVIDKKYHGYIGYYVEIIPQKPKRYNEIFVPSDNKNRTSTL